MAKFTIPVEKLGPPNAEGQQLFRFRIISTDRNRYSQYSTLFAIDSTGQIYPQLSSACATYINNILNVYWDTPSIYNVGASAFGASVLHNHGTDWKVHDADIFVSWDGATFEYQGRSKDNSFAIIKSNAATTARIIGQVANYPPTRSDIFKIFDTGVISVV